MAKETPKHEEGRSKGGKKHHLHEIRSTQAADGSIIHHHSYKESADAMHTMPERGPMATSASPEEAGQHVAEQFGQNGMSAAPDPAAGQGAGGQGEEGPAEGC
jgi:hypothetical protein